MDKIYEKAKDLHVKATYVYGKTNDTAAYTDSECTTKFTTSELKEVFLKGAVILIGGAYYTVLNYTVKNNIGSVTYVKADSTTATTAVLGTLSAVKDPTD